MAIGSPPTTWDLKHTGELWTHIRSPLPNSSGNTGVMVYYLPFEVTTLFDLFYKGLFIYSSLTLTGTN